MFWNKKKPHKKAQILFAYLLGTMPLISGQLKSNSARAGFQVFVMGMVDMLRQAEKLDWNDFISIYSLVLKEYDLLPTMPVEDFINKVGSVASENEDVARVMSQGAQSIRMYVAERDAQAPIDLIGAISYVEKNQDSFSQI